MKTYDLNKESDIMSLGDAIKRQIGCSKKNGYFDWQYVNDDDSVTFEYYWDRIYESFIWNIMSFMKTYPRTILKGGQHDNGNSGMQTALFITFNKGIVRYVDRKYVNI